MWLEPRHPACRPLNSPFALCTLCVLCCMLSEGGEARCKSAEGPAHSANLRTLARAARLALYVYSDAERHELHWINTNIVSHYRDLDLDKFHRSHSD